MKKIFFVLIFLISFTFADCYRSSITSPSPFLGNNDEIFKLLDGSLWEVKYEYEYLYEYYPIVTICPSQSKLIINGKALNIAKLSSGSSSSSTIDNNYMESQIDGEFQGWEGETIFKLTNGQIWQQSSYAYTYSYSYMPRVIIYKEGGRYKMQVYGVSGSIYVERLK